MPEDGSVAAFPAYGDEGKLGGVTRSDLQKGEVHPIRPEPFEDLDSYGVIGNRTEERRLNAKTGKSHQGSGGGPAALTLEIQQFHLAVLARI